ncbi:MAG: spore coat protein [Clostridiales bacterium]|nr:spore coat protein [Clostridiales bacterium]
MISAKELSLLKGTLEHEKLLVKKYRFYATHCSDKELKKKCEQLSEKHKQHFDILLSYLQ